MAYENRGGAVIAQDAEVKPKDFPITGAIFLGCAAGASILFGFGYALGAAKKSDPKPFVEGLKIPSPHLHPEIALRESGTSLALRALGRGTIYAVLGVSAISWGIWKLSGASSVQEFQEKMQGVFPKVKRNDPPVGRTDFASFRDLFEYLSTLKTEKPKKTREE